MKREEFADKGSRLGGGGYFSSIEEMETPKNQAMHALLLALYDKKPKKFISALQNAEKNGWDINKIVFQDSLQSWFTIGAYLASSPALMTGRLFSAYLDYPGVDVSTQEAQVRSKYFRYQMQNKDKDPEAFASVHQTSRVPLVHAFLRQWAQHLPPPRPPLKFANQWEEKKHERAIELHDLASELFGKMNKGNVDWAVKDEHGNGLAHVLVERESSQTLEFLLPWMKNLGVSMSETNNLGMTPSNAGQQRVARVKAKDATKASEITAFRSTLAILERDLLNDTTPTVSNTNPRRRF